MARASSSWYATREPSLRSIRLGRGETFVGARRPLLFHLRNWRKSVAFALAFGEHDNVLVLKYEDAARSLPATAQRIYRHLLLPPFELHGLFDQYGLPFRGNSSLGERSGVESIDAWQTLLDRETIRYVEAVCLPEMHALGYPTLCHDVGAADLSDLSDLSDYVEHVAPTVQRPFANDEPRSLRDWS